MKWVDYQRVIILFKYSQSTLLQNWGDQPTNSISKLFEFSKVPISEPEVKKKFKYSFSFSSYLEFWFTKSLIWWFLNKTKGSLIQIFNSFII